VDLEVAGSSPVCYPIFFDAIFLVTKPLLRNGICKGIAASFLIPAFVPEPESIRNETKELNAFFFRFHTIRKPQKAK
jgi:hypothetical protein